MECGTLTACTKSGSKKRKAAEAALDAYVSDGEAAAPAAVDPAPATQDLQSAAEGRPMAIMSQAWIDSVLARTIKPLPLNERLLQDPRLAAIFRSHEESRARLVEHQNWIRRELEAKGYVEVPDDDYDERCELLQAVHRAVFYGREDEEKEAMAKLAAMRRA